MALLSHRPASSWRRALIGVVLWMVGTMLSMAPAVAPLAVGAISDVAVAQSVDEPRVVHATHDWTPTVANQLEIWLNPSTANVYLVPWSGNTLSLQLSALPNAPFRFTVQFYFLLNSSVCGGSQLVQVASPALTIDY